MFNWVALTTPWDNVGYGIRCVLLPSGRLVIGGASGDGTSSILTSDDDGATWAPVSTPLDSSGIYGLAYSPALTTLVALGGESGGVSAIYSLDDGDTWIAAGNPFPGQGQCVTWNPDTNLFVAGGFAAGRTIAKSVDGTSWTTVASPFDGGFVSDIVQRGVGLWIAVGRDATAQYTAMSSPDAVTWSLLTGPFDGPSAFFGGLARGLVHSVTGWIAAGDSPGVVNAFATSPDFTTWTLRSSAADGGDGQAVARDGAGHYLAALQGVPGASIFDSTDEGATWANNPSSPLDSAYGVTFLADGVAIAVGGLPGLVAARGTYSPPVPPPNSDPGTFVWVGLNFDTDGTTQTSPDGAEWTQRFSPLDNGQTVTAVDASGRDVLAVGASFGGPGVARSRNSGRTWAAEDQPLLNTNFLGVLFATPTLAIITAYFGDLPETIMTGELVDGEFVWTARSSPFDNSYATRCAYSPSLGRLAVLGANGDASSRLVTSDDGGVTWDDQGDPFTHSVAFGFDGFYGSDICWSPELSLFVAVGYQAGVLATELVYTSPDGITWTGQTLPSEFAGSVNVVCVTWDATAGVFVLGTYNGNIAYSYDGITWVASTVPGLDGQINGIKAGAGKWVAVGYPSFGATPNICVSTDLAVWTNETSPLDYGSGGYGIAFAAPMPSAGGARFFEGYPWKLLFTDLDTVSTSQPSALLTNRKVALVLDGPGVITADVLPNNRQVNEISLLDNDPRVAQQNRLVYAFRREGGTIPWKIRAAGILQVLEDQGDADVPLSHLTAYDPWKYLEGRPCMTPDGALPGPDGLLYFARGNTIILSLLQATLDAEGPCFIDFGQTPYWAGVIEDTREIVWRAEQGTMVGNSLTDLCDAGHLDIILRAVYDPINRPGITHDLSIYNLAGDERPTAVFGWDRINRGVTDFSRMRDGTPPNWVNKAQYYVGQGGWPIPLEVNGASVAKYRSYYSQTFFPDQSGTDGDAVVLMAQQAIKLGKQGLRTTTLGPAPQRSPIPLVDYELGDRVRVFASKAVRVVSEGYQRVEGIPIEIDDDGIERVSGLLCCPDWVEAGS